MERSTFVIMGVNGTRVALPVEQVERVLRSTHTVESIRFAERDVPVRPLLALLTRNVAETSMHFSEPSAVAEEHRVLVVHTANDVEPLCAVRVDTVYDVFSIETASVRPVAAGDAVPFAHPAVRGCFDRQDATVWVIDAVRLTERL